MATTQKRGDGCRITVSCGYDLTGKQIRRTTTYRRYRSLLPRVNAAIGHIRLDRLQLGDQWHECGRLFTTWNGQPIHPDTLSGWFHDFIQRNDLPPPIRCKIFCIRSENRHSKRGCARSHDTRDAPLFFTSVSTEMQVINTE